MYDKMLMVKYTAEQTLTSNNSPRNCRRSIFVHPAQMNIKKKRVQLHSPMGWVSYLHRAATTNYLCCGQALEDSLGAGRIGLTHTFSKSFAKVRKKCDETNNTIYFLESTRIYLEKPCKKQERDLLWQRHTKILSLAAKNIQVNLIFLARLFVSLQKQNSQSVCRRCRKAKEESPGSIEHSTS